MKIAAKGMIDPAYFAHGRKWLRHVQLEVEVTAEEYAVIAADPHIVSVVIPDADFHASAEEAKRSAGRPRKNLES